MIATATRQHASTLFHGAAVTTACRYDAACTRRNPIHFMDFTHPELLARQDALGSAETAQRVVRAAAVLGTPTITTVGQARELLDVYHGILSPALFTLSNPDDANVPSEAADIVVRAASVSTRGPLPSPAHGTARGCSTRGPGPGGHGGASGRVHAGEVSHGVF